MTDNRRATHEPDSQVSLEVTWPAEVTVRRTTALLSMCIANGRRARAEAEPRRRRPDLEDGMRIALAYIGQD